jgi:hypothetical protein
VRYESQLNEINATKQEINIKEKRKDLLAWKGLLKDVIFYVLRIFLTA